jgi:hypothetical protein
MSNQRNNCLPSPSPSLLAGRGVERSETGWVITQRYEQSMLNLKYKKIPDKDINRDFSVKNRK